MCVHTYIHHTVIFKYISLKSKYIKEKMLKGNRRNPRRSNGARFPETALNYHPTEKGNKGHKGKMQRLYWFLIIAGIISSKEFSRRAESIQSDQGY